MKSMCQGYFYLLYSKQNTEFNFTNCCNMKLKFFNEIRKKWGVKILCFKSIVTISWDWLTWSFVLLVNQCILISSITLYRMKGSKYTKSWEAGLEWKSQNSITRFPENNKESSILFLLLISYWVTGSYHDPDIFSPVILANFAWEISRHSHIGRDIFSPTSSGSSPVLLLVVYDQETSRRRHLNQILNNFSSLLLMWRSKGFTSSSS